MVSVKERLIKVGISTDQADVLIKNFYIKEKETSDSFAEYYIKRIDEKQDKLSDKVEKLNDKINDLPTTIKNDIKEELKSYATQTDIANLRTDIAKSTNKIIGIMTGVIAVALTIFGLIK